MFLGIRSKYWYYLCTSFLLIGMMMFAHFSPVFALRRFEVKGPLSSGKNMSQILATDSSINIFSLDKSDLALNILTNKKVGNVNIGINFPDGIVAHVNSFAPLALVLDKKLYGMDQQGRIVPYDYAWENIDLPVITGLKVGQMFSIPQDNRIWSVISGLNYASKSLPDLYAAISELDFSQARQVMIYCQHDQSRFVASASGFAMQLDHMWSILNLKNRPIGGCYDLQYDGMIIRRSQ